MIYTVTFNPSLDYIVSMNGFEMGRTNRTTGEQMFPGGKGIRRRVQGKEHRGQAIGVIGVLGAGGEHAGLFCETRPGAQHKADIVSLCRKAADRKAGSRLLLPGRRQNQSRVRAELDFRPCHPKALQLPHRVLLPQGDGVHRTVEHVAHQPHVHLPSDRPDSAAIHIHLVPQPFGGPEGEQVIPQAALAGGVLDEGAAAVNIQLRFPHGPQHF